MNNKINQITKEIQALGDRDIAAHSQRFFKTGKGEYGEGDKFLGIRVPVIRQCVKAHQSLSLKETLGLLKSSYHEIRMLSLLMLVAKYASSKDDTRKQKIYESYLKHTEFINNWDLVDCSAQHIVGAYLFDKERKPIYQLIHSNSLWERRIGVMSTFYFIKKKDFSDISAIGELLLNDREDLIHKAVGWMLRETGKRNQATLENFLLNHYKKMPRTMLRYAIEKLPEIQRQAYLKGAK